MEALRIAAIIILSVMSVMSFMITGIAMAESNDLVGKVCLMIGVVLMLLLISVAESGRWP